MTRAFHIDIPLFLFIVGGVLLPVPAWAQEEPFQGEPEAKALYDKMVDTMREAESLSWVSEMRQEAKGEEYGRARYEIWLKKPNYFRMEAAPAREEKVSGILVGDGDHSWIYWPNGKPRYTWEHKGKYAEEYERHKNTFYMKKRTPLGRHSIGHEAGNLGAGIGMTIIDASTFHGYTDSLHPYLDGVKGMGTEKMGEEEFDVIEVSFMKHQRSWYLWLSRKDHLPRKLKEVVRVSYDIVIHESWSDVAVNPEIPDDKFVWSAPEDWKEWDFPPIEEGLLKPGAEAPDFEFDSLEGGKVKLSDYRGKYVWLNKWRCG